MKHITITREHVKEIYELVEDQLGSTDIRPDGVFPVVPTLEALRQLLKKITGVDPLGDENSGDRIAKAQNLAFSKHAHQTYGKGDSIVSYTKHLEDVVSVLKRFGYSDENYIISGYLHDIIEDTDTSYNDIRSMFGEVIADVVYCVTDELGRNRKEKKAKTYPKIAGNRDALIIKLADRIANIEYGIKTGSSLVQMYKNEQDDFIQSLFVEGFATDMWRHISAILTNPQWFLNNQHLFSNR